MANTKELRDLTSEDVQRWATELRERLFQDKLKLRTGTLEAPTERTKRRRELARVLTVLGEKQRATKKRKEVGSASMVHSRRRVVMAVKSMRSRRGDGSA